jgi:hypothetical protein
LHVEESAMLGDQNSWPGTEVAEKVCPRCGGSVPAEASWGTCPHCRASLATGCVEEAPASPPAPELDVANLMREALKEQRDGEPIDAAIRRVLPGQELVGEEMIYKLISENLGLQERRLGISRQQAAEQMAASEARLKIMPDGTPFLEAFVTNISGLDALPAAMRLQVLQQVKDSLAKDRPGPLLIRTTGTPGQSRSTAILIVIFALTMLAAYLWGLLH